MDNREEKLKKELNELKNRIYEIEIELFNINNKNTINFEKYYLNRVSFYCRIGEFEIISKSKIKEIVNAKRLLILILRDFNLTYAHIGKIFGTNHDSVHYLYRTGKNMLETDKNFNDLYNLIKK